MASYLRTKYLSSSSIVYSSSWLFLEPGAIRMLCRKLLIEQIMYALLCFLQLIVIFSCQVCPLVVVARVSVGIVLFVVFIPCSPTFPHNTAKIGTFPKVAEQPAALIAEFIVHDPN